MPGGVNVPVLIGLVPLFTVTKLTLTEGYKTAVLAGSRLTQLTTPNDRVLEIEATLVGRTRLVYRKGLEAMALTSRALAAATAPTMALAGITVVSATVILTDMQITSLVFTQAADKSRDALTVVIKMTQVPRSRVTAIVGDALDLALAGGIAAVPTVSDMVPLKRQFRG